MGGLGGGKGEGKGKAARELVRIAFLAAGLDSLDRICLRSRPAPHQVGTLNHAMTLVSRWQRHLITLFDILLYIDAAENYLHSVAAAAAEPVWACGYLGFSAIFVARDIHKSTGFSIERHWEIYRILDRMTIRLREYKNRKNVNIHRDTCKAEPAAKGR